MQNYVHIVDSISYFTNGATDSEKLRKFYSLIQIVINGDRFLKKFILFLVLKSCYTELKL